MKVLFLNNDGGGFADYVTIDESTTVEQFLAQHMPHAKSSDYLIRVNRQPISRDYILQDGDRITCTPTKIDGAANHCM